LRARGAAECAADDPVMERAPLVKVYMRSIERDVEEGSSEDTPVYKRAGRASSRISKLCSCDGRPCCSTGLPPCSILWTPIHPITWFAPFVGHLGITDSNGRLHDWGGGPIHACDPKEMMFGAPCRYLPFSPADPAAWDAAIAQADQDYLDHIHCMVCGHDCHSHVAHALDLQEYCHCTWHNKVELAALVFFCGRHIGVSGFVATWLGFAIFLSIVLAVKFGTHP
jgi:hypothetical protein